MLLSFGGYRLKEKLTVTLGHLEASSGLLEVLLPRSGRARIFLSVSTAAGMSGWSLPQDLRGLCLLVLALREVDSQGTLGPVVLEDQ